MKKLIAVAVVSSVMAMSASALPTFYWGTDGSIGAGSGPDIFNEFNVAMPTASTYLTQILKQFDQSVVLTADGTFWSAMGTPGVAYNQPITAQASWSNLPVFVRIYNSSAVGTATKFVNVSSNTLTWTDVPTAAAELNYQFGPVAQTDWQSIPEPAAAMFLLIGAGAIVVRRIRQRNAV